MSDLYNLIRNLSQQEGLRLKSTVENANLIFSIEQDESKALNKAAKYFKKNKNSSKGKLKKVFSAFQKSNNLKHALDVHYKITAGLM